MTIRIGCLSFNPLSIRGARTTETNLGSRTTHGNNYLSTHRPVSIPSPFGALEQRDVYMSPDGRLATSFNPLPIRALEQRLAGKHAADGDTQISIPSPFGAVEQRQLPLRRPRSANVSIPSPFAALEQLDVLTNRFSDLFAQEFQSPLHSGRSNNRRMPARRRDSLLCVSIPSPFGALEPTLVLPISRPARSASFNPLSIRGARTTNLDPYIAHYPEVRFQSPLHSGRSNNLQ